MVAVTDPKTLAELNGESFKAAPVNDANVLAQLNSESQQQPGYFQKLGQDFSRAGENTLQGILGAGDAFRNTLASGLSLLPGVDIAPVKSGEGTAYDVGKFGGNAATFLGGGGLLNAGRAAIASKGLPLISKLASSLEGSPIRDALRRIIGSSAYGALENPNDRTGGALTGAALGGAAETVPLLASTLTKPREIAGNISKYINEQGGKASSLYNDVKNQAGHVEIPIYGDSALHGGKYADLNKNIFNTDPDIKAAHDLFSQNPNVANAHNLQSDIGKEIGALDLANIKGGLSSSDRSYLKELRTARDAIKSDISNVLEKESPDLAQKYEDATKIYREIIEPSRKLKGEETPKDFARVLSGLKKKSEKSGREISPEFQTQLQNLQSALFRQKLVGGGLAASAGMHFLPASELLEAALLGKLSGLKAPAGVANTTQGLIGGIGQGAKSLGDILKIQMMGQN